MCHLATVEILKKRAPAFGVRWLQRRFSHTDLGLRLALLCMAFIISGCASSDQSASASFASVVILNRSVDQIQATTMTVFQNAGYHGLKKDDGTLEFEKEASATAQLAYSSFGRSMFDEKVNVRVRTEIADLGAGAHRLQCQAWIVRKDSNPFFEEEQRRSKMYRGQYQKLLEEVAAKLK